MLRVTSFWLFLIGLLLSSGSGYACGCRAASQPIKPVIEADSETQALYVQAEQRFKKEEYGGAAKLFVEIAKKAPEGSKEKSGSQDRMNDIEKTGAKRLSRVQKKEKDGERAKIVEEYRLIASQFEGLPTSEIALARLAALVPKAE